MKKLAVLFVLAVAVGFLVAPTQALADWRRQHASTCYQQSSLQAVYYDEYLGLKNNTSYAQLFICPFVSDSYLPQQYIWTLNVHGYKNSASGTDQAWACVKYWGWYNWTCGVPNSTTTSGPWTLNVLADAWRANPADFAYVKANLQPGSALYGFFASN